MEWQSGSEWHILTLAMRVALKSLFSGWKGEAWWRFFVAIAGLALAFVAALFSTVASQAGNVWGTLISASLALLVAGLVGVTTVPYLARRVAVCRVRDVFDYDITREGLGYLGAVLVIAIAALNTGNNLLFIIVAAMLAAVVVSGVVSAAGLAGLELEVSVPAHVFSGSKSLARFSLRNRYRLLPSFSVSVVPQKPRGRKWAWRRSDFGIPFSRPPEKQWLRLPDLAITRMRTAPARANIFAGKIYFPYLPAKRVATADVELCFERRGRYQQEGFGLATRFPFSFLVKTRRVPLKRELIVYPRVQPPEEFFEILPLITGEFEAFVRGRGHDLYRIREYAPEDSARSVDWKATAKSGSLKVREFSREDERKLRIVFDNPAPHVIAREAYESGIELAASLAWHFADENAELSFAAAGFTDSGDVYDFLRYLALAQPVKCESVLDSLEVTGDYNVILTARARGTIPTRLWSCSYFLFLG